MHTFHWKCGAFMFHLVVALVMLQRSQSQGLAHISLQPTQCTSQSSDATEAQRLTQAFKLYIHDTIDDAAVFDFGTYNSLERGQALHPRVLATTCRSFIDRLLVASFGRIRSKQALDAAIMEMLRTHTTRDILGKTDRGKFASWLKARVSLYVVVAVRVCFFICIFIFHFSCVCLSSRFAFLLFIIMFVAS